MTDSNQTPAAPTYSDCATERIRIGHDAFTVTLPGERYVGVLTRTATEWVALMDTSRYPGATALDAVNDMLAAYHAKRYAVPVAAPAADMAPLEKIKGYLAMYEEAGEGYFWISLGTTDLHKALLQLSGEIDAYYSGNNDYLTGEPLLAGWLLCAMNRGLVTVRPVDQGIIIRTR